MCGVASLPKERYFMTLESAEAISSVCAQLNPQARVEFAMHGEPLLNPEWFTIIALFRQSMKAQLQLTTNGTLTVGDWATWLRWFTLAGLNVVLVDLYEPYGGELRQEILANTLAPWRCVNFYESRFSPWHNHGANCHVVVLMDDLMKRSGERSSRKITNQGGNSPLRPPLEKPLAKTCTIPFRELSVRWDGQVGICCNDWRLQYRVGNIIDEGTALWGNERFMGARRLLQAKQRSFSPCAVCDVGAGSYVGFLPRI